MSKRKDPQDAILEYAMNGPLDKVTEAARWFVGIAKERAKKAAAGASPSKPRTDGKAAPAPAAERPAARSRAREVRVTDPSTGEDVTPVSPTPDLLNSGERPGVQ